MKTNKQTPPAESDQESDWAKTATNLYRYKPSGIYFARVRIKGKLFRKSLETDVVSVARLRLVDFIKEKRQDDSGAIPGHYEKMTVGQCISIFRQRL